VSSSAPVLAYAGSHPDAPIPYGPALPLEPPPLATPSGADVPAGNPSVLPSGAVPLGSRSLARHEHRRRARRVRAVLAALIVLALIVAAFEYVGHRGGGTHTVAPVVAGPNRVVLLEVTAPGGAKAAALLGDQHGTAGAVVLVPPQLAVDAGSFGGVTLATAATLPGTASADALSDALGITIDGTWNLSTGGLAALVDGIGGVDADVDVDVRQGNVIQVPAGQQHLDGVAAVAYATYAATGEPAQAQLARLDTVLDAVISGLSDQSAAVTAQLAGLGASSQSTLPVAQLGDVLSHLHALDATDSLVYTSLPVHEIDDGDVSTYTLDTAGAAQSVTDLTGRTASADTAATGIRVLVRNGVGTPGLGDTTRAKLKKAGDVFISGGNQLPFDKDPTVILITDDTPAERALGNKVALALGIPQETSLRVTGQGQSIADVVVVLGTDYHP
jgi:LytR cell envelope-related transcriptional attenuator/LytR_cpsA_psr family